MGSRQPAGNQQTVGRWGDHAGYYEAKRIVDFLERTTPPATMGQTLEDRSPLVAQIEEVAIGAIHAWTDEGVDVLLVGSASDYAG